MNNPPLRQRPLGNSGRTVSAIGLGCWGMSGSYGAADEQESAATLHHALDVGINFLDTADCYGDGHNESLLGRTLRQRRNEFVLATKTGFVSHTNEQGQTATRVNGQPERIAAACDASLQRLRTDYIDLYYLHRVDPTVPIEDSVGALAELVTAGKVRWLGLCEASAATLRRACSVHPITAVQSEYSLWTRDVESGVLPACRQAGLSLVPFSPLGRGFLTGSLRRPQQLGQDDWRATNPRFSSDNWQRNSDLLKPLQDLAARRGCTPAQMALAWLLSRDKRIIPIPGTKRRAHLDQNLQACELELSPEEEAQLDTTFHPTAAAGQRYSDDFMRWLDR